MAPLKAISFALLTLFGCAETPSPQRPIEISDPVVLDRPHPVAHREPKSPATVGERFDEIDATLKHAGDVIDAHEKR